MRGSAVPVASAGSKKAGVSETWTPHVMVPSAAGAGALHATRARASAAATHRGKADIMRVILTSEGAQGSLAAAMCSPSQDVQGDAGPLSPRRDRCRAL